jgi:hypothetical protein
MSTWYLVLRSKYQIPNTKYLMSQLIHRLWPIVFEEP